ncbi:MAG: hypothetical protein C0444_10555 [Microbacterium sp.]|nr:hypothetical protein [Microbacterium sp.]MBA4345606.1 hypothetical protein [Microbacterium sp.]
MTRSPSHPQPIVVQYRPPEGLSVVEAAELLQQNSRAVVAQLIDFAARRIVVMVPGPKRRSFRVVRTARAVTSAAEEAILAAVFGDRAMTGASVTLTRHRNEGLSRRLADAHRGIAASLIERGLVAERSFASRLARFWDPRPVAPTDEAAPVLAHLEGLRQYIALAEADRMRVLLGPDSAMERRDESGESTLVIHEKLLGYAVLFGLEKQWAARLAADYAAERPGREPVGIDDLTWVDVALWEVVTTSADLQMEGLDLSALPELPEVDLDLTVGAADVLDGLGAFFGGL